MFSAEGVVDEDAGDFLPGDEEVVGPLDGHPAGERLQETGYGQGGSHREGELTGGGQPAGIPQQRHQQIVAGRGEPAVVPTPSSGKLVTCRYQQRCTRMTLLCQRTGYITGGGGLPETDRSPHRRP